MKSQSRNRLMVAAAAFAGLLFFVWWGSFDSVGDILKDPDRYGKGTVHLFGRVGTAYNIPFVGGLYKFNDTSGGMWVISERDSTTEGRIMYIEAAVHASPSKKTLKLKGKLEALLDHKIFEESQMPPVLVEKEQGGLVASLKAVRARK